MAYGLLYNLNFSSNTNLKRKHRISIYKDGHTSTITVNDNNIIGTEEPAVLTWDNTDDIYNNIMASRLEINLYTDDVKQVDIDDILTNSSPSKFLVEFRMEDSIGGMQLYWSGYLANATYEQGISSIPVPYQLVATDLLGTLKNIYSTDGTAIIDSQPTMMKYLDNVLAFLPQNLTWKVSSDVQAKPFSFFGASSFTKMQFLQWLFPYKNGFDLAFETASEYVINTLKVINARLFYANNSWYITSNSSYKDTATFDSFDTSGNYSTTFVENVVKTIPTNYTPVLNDMAVRYDTPIDAVEVIANRNQYATDFFGIGLTQGEISNLTPYPNFETLVNGILFNSTYYSNDFNFIQEEPKVKAGNYSIKTQNYITGGNPTQKILDTGFAGNFQLNVGSDPTFFCSYFMQNSPLDKEDFHLYYSIARETSPSASASTGAKEYWNGNNWVSYTLDSQIAILADNNQTAPTDQWVEFSIQLQNGATVLNYARYRIILWQPKINNATTPTRTIYFDEVLLNRRNVINFDAPVKTTHKIQGVSKKNKKYTYEFQHFYPVFYYTTEFQTDDISYTGIPGSTELNSIIAQQILNDNRKHVKRYTTSVYANNFGEFLYPYHKIDINMTGFQSDNTCIIDRLQYRAKSGFYKIECHETNQGTNVTLDTKFLGGSAI